MAHEDAASSDGVTALVGRVREVGVLEDLLGSASGQGGSLIVRGEPGIGKSALLDVACTLWAARGGRVLRTDGFQVPGRAHFIIGQEGWQEVADYALSWATEHARVDLAA